MGRPNFIPWMWGRGPRNRRLWDRPDKVLRWFLYYTPIGMTVLAALVWAGEDRTLRYVTLGGVVLIGVQALVYGPRAWRASRAQRRLRREGNGSRSTERAGELGEDR